MKNASDIFASDQSVLHDASTAETAPPVLTRSVAPRLREAVGPDKGCRIACLPELE
jgi:hypothetical protein